MASPAVQPITVVGVVTPAAWDDRDRVTEVMVEWCPPGEDEPVDLLLDPGTSGRALERLVGRRVSFTGIVTVNHDGDPVMLVSDVELQRARLRD